MKKIDYKDVIYKFKNNMPYIDIVKPGETFQVETNDCFFQQIINEEQTPQEINHDILNPATGPIYVEGAEIGDILEVKIIDIQVEDKGVCVVVKNEGALGNQVKEPIVRIINIEDDHALFAGKRIPINPMIGVIGVAPHEDDGEWQTNSPWKHGGNMDTKEIVKGTSLYFQVESKGGLLALGDCHALMGDGEVCFTGLEIPALVTLEVNVLKDKAINWPILKRERETVIIASGDTLEEAMYTATTEAVNYISKALKIQWEEAYIMASLTVDLRISQVVNPKYTVRAAIPNNIVETEEIINILE